MSVNQPTPAVQSDLMMRAMAALRAAGMLEDPSPATRGLARHDAMTLEEMRAALAGGPSLVDIVDELRVSKS